MRCCNAAACHKPSSFQVEVLRAYVLRAYVSPKCFLVCYVFFSFAWCRVEEYANPRTVLFVTLTKTFLMEAVVIGIVASFWITFRDSSQVGSL